MATVRYLVNASVTIAISRCKSHLLRRALLDLDNVR